MMKEEKSRTVPMESVSVTAPVEESVAAAA